MNFEIKNKLLEAEFLCGKYINGPFLLAGGAVRDIIMGEKPRDYDLFFTDKNIYNQACENMEYHAKKIKQRRNSTLYKLKDGAEIDLVFSTYNFENIHLNFDLHHCCVSFFNGDILKSNMFNTAIEDRELILNVVTYPYLTLSRISKFKSRGWNIIEEQERLILDYCYKAPWGASKEIEYSNAKPSLA